MGFATGLMVFFILWWVVIFTVLPFGVRTVEEEGGTVERGHAPSAPVRPMLLKKALITTAITAVLWPPERAPVIATVYITETAASFDDRNAAIAEIGGAIAAAVETARDRQ